MRPVIYCEIILAALKYPQYVYLFPYIENSSPFNIGILNISPLTSAVNTFVYDPIVTPTAYPIPETVPKNNEFISI